MNKREYDIIGQIMQEVYDFTRQGTNDNYLDGKYDTWFVTVNLLCSRLEEEYPKTFHRDKFLKACGV